MLLEQSREKRRDRPGHTTRQHLHDESKAQANNQRQEFSAPLDVEATIVDDRQPRLSSEQQADVPLQLTRLTETRAATTESASVVGRCWMTPSTETALPGSTPRPGVSTTRALSA